MRPAVTPVPRADLSPDMLLSAYAQGVFPMTDPDGVTRWYSTDPRGVLPLDGFHCPRTLRQIVRQRRFDVRVNTAFERVMRHCMTVPRGDRESSWISDELVAAYARLHEMGFAHSVEAWQGDQLVGGLYGVSLRGAFFGESMFALASNASKVCLVHLVERLRERGYALLDTQMVTNHMRQFGCIHVPASDYMDLLDAALVRECTFVERAVPATEPPAEAGGSGCGRRSLIPKLVRLRYTRPLRCRLSCNCWPCRF
jgi:leucyl/phenylalanyl-tRNA---protein transferase